MESAFRSAIDGLTAYASGLSRPADFMAAAQAGHAVGVVAEELSASAMALLAQAVVDFRIPLFVDSGAYGHFRRDGPMSSAAIDFAVVLQAYDDVLEAICAENAAEEHLPPPLLVMPDVPGDQAASARQLWAHRGYVSSLLRFPRLARPIIPLHHGRRPLSWLYRDLVQMLGSEGFIVGIPAAAAALPASAISELFTNAAPRAVHVLGALSERRLHPRIWPGPRGRRLATRLLRRRQRRPRAGYPRRDDGLSATGRHRPGTRTRRAPPGARGLPRRMWRSQRPAPAVPGE